MLSNRKIVLIGTGLVGMSFAYGVLIQNICDELCLIDIDKKRAEGEAMDLNHGLAFSGANMKVYAGEYADCGDADIVVIAAGVSQRPGESRLDLLSRNAQVFRSIIDPVMDSGFGGVFLIATNPVDIMTHVAHALSGLPSHRVLGTGTTLDTARLKYMLGSYFSVDPRNVHAYVMGEHGDSEFIPWSQAHIANKPLRTICEESGGRFCLEQLEQIGEDVRHAAQRIIAAKKATYYGIGMALCRICRAVLGDENSVLTVSSLLRGQYGEEGVYVGVPCVVGATGVRELVRLNLEKDELTRLHTSCELLRDLYQDLGL